MRLRRSYNEYEVNLIKKSKELLGEELGKDMADKLIDCYSALIDVIRTSDKSKEEIAVRIISYDKETLEYLNFRMWETGDVKMLERLSNATELVYTLKELKQDYKNGVFASSINKYSIREKREIMYLARLKIDLINRSERISRHAKRDANMLINILGILSDQLDEDIVNSHHKKRSKHLVK